jgi:5,10-methylenetetrahydromethanopterin reductase
VAWAVEHVRAGAREAGRREDEVEISLLAAMVVADEVDAALAACRWSAASAVNHLSTTARGDPVPEPVRRLVAARHGGDHDYYHHLEAGGDDSWLSDELVDDFAVAGPPERCLARLRELAALGVSEVSFLCTEPAQLERIGREVVPGLAR